MQDAAVILGFLLAALAVMVVPGPMVTALVATSLSRSARAAFAMELGAQLGRLTMVLVVGLGLTAVNRFVGFAFDWIKLAGAAYLIWRGVLMLLNRISFGKGQAVTRASPWHAVPTGFLLIWSNPKALLFFGAFLPGFVDAAHPALPQALFFGLLAMATALVSDATYVLLAARARELLTDRLATGLNRAGGAILLVGGVWLALQTKA
ncbi:MAG: LysE family translocator [Cucumibacter sp.]